MKILIHGRKNGYTVLYPKPTPAEFYSFASDIQSISATNDAIYYNKNFYTLAFVDGGSIFTKYIFGDDVERGQLGEIGISVFIPKDKKMAGSDVKSLLDELINIYSRNYIINNQIVEPQNGFDWLLFTSVANSYDAKLCNISPDDVENYSQGQQDAAFVFFKDTAELQKYFDAPFQEEYTPYRQILFVSSDLKDRAENPLNALRNSGVDLSGKIDLENPKYKLLFNQNAKGGVRIDVKVNGSTRSNKYKIRRKNDLEITWKKDYYKPVMQGGKCYEISSNFIYVDDVNQIVQIKEIELQPQTKEFTISVIKDKTKETISDAEIICNKKFSNETKSLENGKVTFIAEELEEKWILSAKKGKDLFSNEREITPENEFATDITLSLIEKRVVKITANDQENGDAIWQFKVHITGKNFYKVADQIEFTGEEIDKEWDIQIEKRPEYVDSKNIKFYPAQDGNEINFTLKKKPKAEPSGHSNSINNCSERGTPPHIDKKQQQESFAQKGKVFLSKPTVISGAVVGVLILGVGIWALFHSHGKDTQPTLAAQQITAYVEGDALLLDTLNAYKGNWEKQKPKIETSGGAVWYEPKTWFVGNNGANADSTNYKKWNESAQSIEQAINKRKLIDSKNFAKLKEQDFSKQSAFKTTIEKLDSTKYEEVQRKLGNVSALTLTQIADSINAILTPKETVLPQQPQESKKDEKKAEPQQVAKTAATKPTAQPAQQENVSTDKTFEIIAYIRGNELKKETLNQYLKDAGKNQPLKASINLCLEFWNLDGSKNKSYYSFQQKIDTDANLKDSELKNFVDGMCSQERPKYLKEMAGNSTIFTLTQLKSKIK